MARLRKHLYSYDQAAAACRRLREGRERAHEDLGGFPVAVHDVTHVEEVARFVQVHIPRSVALQAAELRDRATLVEYLRQQYEARLVSLQWSVLDVGHRLGVSIMGYASQLGCNSRQAGFELRKAVAARRERLRDARILASVNEREPGSQNRASERRSADEWSDDAFVSAPSDTDQDGAGWRALHSRQLRSLADALIDHRDTLLELVGSQEIRDYLAVQLDAVGENLDSRVPSLKLCLAMAIGTDCLRAEFASTVPDPALRDQIADGHRLLYSVHDPSA